MESHRNIRRPLLSQVWNPSSRVSPTVAERGKSTKTGQLCRSTSSEHSSSLQWCVAEGLCARRSVVHFIGLCGFVSSLNLFGQFFKSGKALASAKSHSRKFCSLNMQCAMEDLLLFVLNLLLSGLISWPLILGWEETVNTCPLYTSCVICGFIDLSHFMVSIVSFPVAFHLSSFHIYQLPLSWLQQCSFIVTEGHGALLGGKWHSRNELCQVPRRPLCQLQWHGGEGAGQKLWNQLRVFLAIKTGLGRILGGLKNRKGNFEVDLGVWV